ncbi:MAG: hypothetical protein O2913_12220 [Chloroflexi bacterium]|nr:hypothetical protein [Chloroflexota bacterium]
MTRLEQTQPRKALVKPMQKTASDPRPTPDDPDPADAADTRCGVDYFTFVIYPPPPKSLGQRPSRRRRRKFTMSAHPDDFEFDRAPTLEDMTRSCARRNPGYASCVRRVVRLVLAKMGYQEEDLLDRKGCFGGYRWRVGLPGGGQVQFGPDRVNGGVIMCHRGGRAAAVVAV